MAYFRFLLTLVEWYINQNSFYFDWDKGNIAKSQIKHGVSLEEVESVFTLRQAIPLGIQVTPKVDEERFCVIGLSDKERLISVVFTLRDGKVRPISSRVASQKERKSYEEIRQTLEGL